MGAVPLVLGGARGRSEAQPTAWSIPVRAHVRRAQRVALTAEGARTLASVDSSARAWLLATSHSNTPAELEVTRRFLLTVIACAEAVASP